jgi:hypothetical protein
MRGNLPMQPLTSVFHWYLAVVRRSGTLTADQPPICWPNRRFGLMRSERKKYRQRHRCACRNQEDCMLSHPSNMRPASDFSNVGLLP